MQGGSPVLAFCCHVPLWEEAEEIKKCLKRDTSDTRKRETGNSSMGKRETDYLNYSRYNAKMQALMERNLPVFEENLLVFDRKCGLR